MKYALYGSHRKNYQSIICTGITRQTAAYFLLPEIIETEQLRATLVCSVFHAIGLSVINRAIQNQSLLSEELIKEGGVSLFIFALDDVFEKDSLLDTYQYKSHITYPYGKVMHCGPIISQIVRTIDIPTTLFPLSICSEHKQDSKRFFQKNGGQLQFLKNCNINNLERMCINAAQTVEQPLIDFINFYSKRR